MSLLSESFTLGDKYLISIKLETDKWREYFHPELFEECPGGEPSEIILAKNIIKIVSGFEEYMMVDDMWQAYATDLFTCETKLAITRFTPTDGMVGIVTSNHQFGNSRGVLTIFLNKDHCSTIFK